MSSAQFNIYISDLEEKLRERNEERVRIDRNRVWSLVYADDIVLLRQREKS